jgi:bacterial/archaeal transporter family-2 protein
MSRTVAFITTVAAGGLIALQPSANAALGNHVGDLGAAFISTVITMVIISVLLLIFGHPGRLSGLSSFRFEHALGGIGGAVVVTVTLVAVRPLGTGVVIALLVAAQLVVGLIVDRIGWLGIHQIGLSPARLIGLGLVVAGTVLITRG